MKTYRTGARLLTVAALSTLVLAGVAAPTSVKADGGNAVANQAGFSFVATILDSNGLVLSGKTVSLSDVTDGTAKPLASQTSNQAGQAVFSNLPLGRNISVSVDGVVKGYTVRTDVAGSKHMASFKASGVGTVEPTYSTQKIDITVRDQEGEVLKGQTVALKDQDGREIGSGISGDNGLVSFGNKLMDGTFYDVYLNGQKLDPIMPGNTRTVYVDTSKLAKADDTSSANSASENGHFSFTVTALDKEGKVVEGKEVVLEDITDGQAVFLAKMTTNADGQAAFTNLPLSRNISVKIDGQLQGYTVRTDQADSHKATAFYVDGKGSKFPDYSKKPATVSVLDEDGNAISGQTVSLKNRNGDVVATAQTDANGQAVFSDKLMDGVLYDVFVNDLNMSKPAMTGESVTAYLQSNQVKKQVAVNKADSNSTNQSTNSQPVVGQVASNQPSSDGKEGVDQTTDTTKMDGKMLAASDKVGKVSVKPLPKTGEKLSLPLVMLGMVLAGVAFYFSFFTKKKLKRD